MATSLLELRDKAHRWLIDLGIDGIGITKDGGYAFRIGSTRTNVRFLAKGEGEKAFTAVTVL